MRILHSLAPGAYGGLEEVVILLARGLLDRGHELGVAVTLTAGSNEHPFLRELEAQGITAHPVLVTARGYLAELAAIRKLADATEPDVLHTHGYRPGVLHPLATRGFDTRRVTTLHGFTGGGLKNRLYERIQLRSARRYDAVVAVAGAMRPRLAAAGIGPERTHVIPNAWRARHEPLGPDEARAEVGVSRETFHVGWVGRLSEEKGADVFAKACFSLTHGATTASIVGDGPLAAELRQQAGGHPAADVRLHGSIPSAARLMAGFDVFVLSSRTEGTPIVLFEAMQAGVPIIATSVGGVPDVLDDTTAILVPSEDPRALAEAMRTIHDHPEAARRRAAAARTRLVETFAIGPWIDRHEALYASLARQR